MHAGPCSAAAPVAAGRDGRIGHVDPELGEEPRERPVQREVAGDVGRVAGVERLGQRVDPLEREAERLGHLAHRATAPGT